MVLLRQDDFVLGKKLGEGAFGVVYKASLANPEAAKKVKPNVASACKYSVM
jgi:serine/threonine protein kinase